MEPVPEKNILKHGQARTDRGSGVRPLSGPLQALAAAVMGPEWRVINQLLKNWPAIVGNDLARHATPVKVRLAAHPQLRDRARLTVRIPGALAPQFQMMEGQMQERINRIMGYDFVEKIIFEHKVGN
jgi:hypothetical protein